MLLLLQFAVRRLQLQVSRVSNFSKEFDLHVFDAAGYIVFSSSGSASILSPKKLE